MRNEIGQKRKRPASRLCNAANFLEVIATNTFDDFNTAG